MRTIEDFHWAIRELNCLRILIGDKVVTKKDFKEKLRNCGLPYNAIFWDEFSKSGIIIEHNDGWKFANPDTPVYIQKLKIIHHLYKKRYEDELLDDTKREIKLEQIRKQEIDNAIKFLNDLGYQVFKPVGNLFAKV